MDFQKLIYERVEKKKHSFHNKHISLPAGHGHFEVL